MRKKLKILGITLGLGVTLLVLFVTAFIWNPFEGSLPDMRELVPRDVDYFLRKTDLRDDFDEFPVPAFWAELESSNEWRSLRSSPLVRDSAADVSRLVESLRDAVEQVKADSGGTVDVLDDALGTETLVAGRFRGTALDEAAWCLYARVSWKLRFAWGLGEWGSVQEQLRAGGLDVQPVEGDSSRLLLKSGGQEFQLARYLDCLLVANDEQLMLDSLALATGQAQTDSLGGSSDYRDGVERRIREWEAVAEIEANALEVYMRPDQLFQMTRWDDNWPDPRHPDSMNERVLASFLSLKSWRFLTGSLLFEDLGSMSVLGRIDLNRNDHTPFQTKFFQTEAQDHREWLLPFLALVPEGSTRQGVGACAAAAIRMPAGDFLVEMYEALDENDRTLINDALRNTGKYEGGVRELIDALRVSLEPRTGFVFMRAQDLGDEIVVNDPSPAPHVAWVFWIRKGLRKPLEAVQEFLKNNHARLGFNQPYVLPVSGGRGGDQVLELPNPNIPGTGMFAVLLFGDFFVLSNSSYLVRDMIQAQIQSRNLMSVEDYQVYAPELERHLSGFVYLNGSRVAEIVEDYLTAIDQAGAAPNTDWMVDNRIRIEQEVARSEFTQYGTPARIPESERERFDAAVDQAMEREWVRQRARFQAGDKAALTQWAAMAKLFSSAYLQLNLDPQSMSFTGRALMNW